MEFVPAKEDFEDVLRVIYQTRSTAIHAGEAWPPRISAGLGPRIPVDAVRDLFKTGVRIPAVTWFEKVVNTALNLYLKEATAELAD